MALTLEWMNRLKSWKSELERHLYLPLGEVTFEGFTTFDQLSAAQAAARPDFRPMPPAAQWGAKWEYAWFRAEVIVPPEAAGRRVVLRPDVAPECLIYIDGQPAGCRDGGREVHTLSRKAAGGERFDVLIEAYGGHGGTPCGIGPTPPGRESVPEPPPTQRTVGASTFGVWDEDAYGLLIDLVTLWDVRDLLTDDDLRRCEIDQGLRDFALIVNFEAPLAARRASFRAARKRLAPLLACRNGSTAPTMFAFGHGHLDIAWLWPLAETERKVARTFSNQLGLMDEYPAYKFLQSQPHLLRMCKRLYPELYARVRKAARRGQFVVEGAMWVEADTNIAGGEALVRQCLHGIRFMEEEFGVRSRLLWLPDVFGYSGALPQILAGCGVRYFATAKIFWNYNGGDPFPHNTFTWEGIDGSEVRTHLFRNYNAWTRPAETAALWNARPQKDGLATQILSFGHGDGGGGPCRDHVEFALRQEDLEGAPRIRMDGPIAFFRDQEARGWPDRRYVGELYYQCHRGTYTSQARTKRGNRKAELALREAEVWGAFAGALTDYAWPAAAMDEVWKTLLLCQFHDILPGSSIHRVYEEAEAAQAGVIEAAARVAAGAADALLAPAGAVTVFNSLARPRRVLVALPAGWTGAADAQGRTLAVQTGPDETLAEVAVPACGHASLVPAAAPRAGKAARGSLKATTRLIENEFLRLEIDAAGRLERIYDKESDRDLAAGPCNDLRLFRDIPAQYDAWDIDSMYELEPVAVDAAAVVEVAAAGPLVAAVRVTRRVGDSDLVQEIRLRAGGRRVDFVTQVDWRERHKMLKVAFPVAVHASEAVHEIQFGHIRRPNHRSRPFDEDRFEVSNHKWTALVEEGRGCAVLNDCKYGVNVLGNTIALTLLRSPLGPDAAADQGPQEFTYAFLAWNTSLADSPVVSEAYDLNVPVVVRPGKARTRSLLSVDAPNVIVEAVKPAEDGTGDVVVRLYEAKRTATRATLTLGFNVGEAFLADLLEQACGGELEVKAGRIALEFRPFEIKTVRLRPAATKKRRGKT